MSVVAVTGSETALLIMAAFWAVLVVVLCVVLIGTYNVLTSTKMTIDTMREETVPLLREIKTTVEKTNREIDRVDTVLASAGSVVGRVERISGLVEEAAPSPLVKLISVGAGAAQGGSRRSTEGAERRAPAVLARVRAWARRGRPRWSTRAGPGGRSQRPKPAAIAREAKGGLLDLSKLVAESIEEGRAARWPTPRGGAPRRARRAGPPADPPVDSPPCEGHEIR